MKESATALNVALADASAAEWWVRAAAGRRLAGAVGTPAVAEVLLRLLLDPDDTAVTSDTARALFERETPAALRLLALAAARADDNHLEWLTVGMQEAFLRPDGTERDMAGAYTALAAEDQDPEVRRGAVEFLEWLGAPVPRAPAPPTHGGGSYGREADAASP